MILLYFNTSNVTIQLAKINLGNFRSIISIHLMLLFNHIVLIFQHLLLQISIHLMLLFNLLIVAVQHRELYFNTSNVTIQLIDDKYDILCVSYFNTSNVTIQRQYHIQLHSETYFNTSNVTIQRHILYLLYINNHISIHLMLLFNNIDTYENVVLS